MELRVLEWLAAHRTPLLDVAMLGLTNIGRGGLAWAVAAILRARLRPRLAMAACQVILAVTVAWIVPDAVVKPLTARPRPFVASTQLHTLVEHPGGYSFPSGHAATAVAGAYSLSAMWPPARLYCWGLAALIMASRAYLGVHYPTDLLGGALLGWFIGWFVVGRTRWSAARPHVHD